MEEVIGKIYKLISYIAERGQNENIRIRFYGS